MHVFRADTASRAETNLWQRRCDRFQRCCAAIGFSWEEFQVCIALSQRLHHFRRRCNTWDQRSAVLFRVRQQLVGEPWADNKLGTRGNRSIILFWIDYGTGTDHRFWHCIGNRADSFQSSIGTQGNFEYGDPAISQCFGHRNSVFHLVDNHYRNNR